MTNVFPFVCLYLAKVLGAYAGWGVSSLGKDFHILLRRCCESCCIRQNDEDPGGKLRCGVDRGPTAQNLNIWLLFFLSLLHWNPRRAVWGFSWCHCGFCYSCKWKMSSKFGEKGSGFFWWQDKKQLSHTCQRTLDNALKTHLSFLFTLAQQLITFSF